MNTQEDVQTMNEEVSQVAGQKPPYLVLGALVIALLSIPVFFLKRKTDATLAPAGTANKPYKDGTFDAEGSYMSPAGPEKILVKITLKDGKVTDAEATTPPGTVEKSTKFQGMFISGFKEQVVGKDIATVKLSKVSGSSLTPIGFNDAVQKIMTQAKSS